MSVNLGLAQVSGDFLVAAIVIYSLAVIGFAGDFAFGRPRRAAAAGAAVASGERAAQLATVGAAQGAAQSASGGAAGAAGLADGAQAAPADAGAGDGDAGSGAVLPARQVPALRAIWEAGPWVRAAVAFSALGIAAHVVAVVTRGLAVHRAPWGNMYEFVTALTCVAAIFFCYVMVRYRAWALGVFVIGAVVVALGLAETVIYTAAGPLVPALQSYWIAIHVTAMIVAIGLFIFGAVVTTLYLLADRSQRRLAAGQPSWSAGIWRHLPVPAVLDRLTYRSVLFGFPVWTFGVMAGAIWADHAWGRYWGWDPKETWSFITWVVYAMFLHARATAGWRGRRAAWIQLAGFACLMFNVIGVNLWITGLHSYAGMS